MLIISVYEFIRGRKDYSHAKKLLEELAGIASLDNNVIFKATEIWRELTRRKKDDRDLLIGATAIVLNMHLYTRNRKHYSRLQKYGLKLYKNGEAKLSPAYRRKPAETRCTLYRRKAQRALSLDSWLSPRIL